MIKCPFNLCGKGRRCWRCLSRVFGLAAIAIAVTVPAPASASAVCPITNPGCCRPTAMHRPPCNH